MIKIKKLLLKHKVVFLIVLLLIGVSAFFINKQTIAQNNETKTITQEVKLGNIDVSISGAGQISSLDEIQIKSEVSGKIIYSNIILGKEVKRGNLLFQIDDSNALKELRSAELSLESALLSLEKTKAGASELVLLQAENSLIQAKETKEKAESNLIKSYEDSFNTISNTFLDLPTLMTGLKDIIFGYEASVNGVQENYNYYASIAGFYDNRSFQYKDEIYNKYQSIKLSYDANINSYKETNRYSKEEDIEKLIDETYETTKAIADLIKSTINLIDFYKYTLINYNINYLTIANTHLSSLSNYTGKTNSHLSNLLSANNNIKNYKESIISAERTIIEKELALTDLKNNSNDLEIRTQQLAVEEKENNIKELRDNLSKYYLYAPFDGTITNVNFVKGDTINSGTSVASLITKTNVANINLNEIDIVKVKLGQKTFITFDAIDNLIVEGVVSYIDATGTVNQGVVSYNVKISFDSKDERIKPGMSMSASINIESANNVLVVSSNSIKTQPNGKFIDVLLDDGTTERKKVETGISNDILIEIKSGLKEGEKILIGQTTNNTNTQNINTNRNTNYPNNNSNNMMRMMR